MPNNAKTLVKILLWGTALGAVSFTSALVGVMLAPMGFVGYKTLKYFRKD